jgi:hypothetical protein
MAKTESFLAKPTLAVWEQEKQAAFRIEALTSIRPQRILEIGVSVGNWAALARQSCERPDCLSDQSRWKVHIERIVPLGVRMQAMPSVHDCIVPADEKELLSIVREGADLIILDDILGHWSKAIAVEILDTAIEAAEYVLVSNEVAADDGSRGQDHSSCWTFGELLNRNLIRFCACNEPAEMDCGLFLLSANDPKALRTRSFAADVFRVHCNDLLKLGAESVCGPGSSLSQTDEIRRSLPVLIESGIRRQTQKKASIWSIGIFSGPSLADLKPTNETDRPVLSAGDVTDIPAQFVADPFMIQTGGVWYMFFEVMNSSRDMGEIGMAISRDGLKWEYQQIVLREPFHLSYPYVFQCNGEYFMIPESFEAGSMRLYKADAFPLKWTYVATLLEGPWVDSSIFNFDGQWWMFSTPVIPHHQVLELFYADAITGPWHRHPMSPLVSGNNRMARCGGRVILLNERPVRFTQDCFPFYGTSVRAFEVSLLTTSAYEENELPFSPLLTAGQEPWRREGMHHIDPHYVNGRWLACVDGWHFETSDGESESHEKGRNYE